MLKHNLRSAVPASRHIVFFAIVVGACAADLATKSCVFRWLGPPGMLREPWWLWKGVFGFQTSLNWGALFGMGQGFWPLFAALSVAAAVGIGVWLFGFGAARDWLLTVALALVTAGILGNLYDRLALHGLRDARRRPGSRRAGLHRHVPGRPVALAQLQSGRQRAWSAARRSWFGTPSPSSRPQKGSNRLHLLSRERHRDARRRWIGDQPPADRFQQGVDAVPA